MNEKQKKITIIVSVVLILGTAFLFSFNKKEEKAYKPEVKELPLKVDLVPVNFDVIDENGMNILNCSFENKSDEDITSFVLEIKFKGMNETKCISFDNLIIPGETSDILKVEIPKNYKKDDIQILKYKISTADGVYMEYDVNLKQYNWS